MSATLEYIACPLCGGSNSVHVLEGRDFLLGGKDKFRIAECASCGHRYVNPRPTRQAMDRYYPNSYEMYDRRNGIVESFRSCLDRHRARWLARLLPLRGRVLEVGCSTGEFLVLLRQQGIEVEGVEYSPYAAAIARERFGLKVKEGLVEELQIPAQAFDLIVMRHVIEHLYDPVAVCRKLVKALRSQGQLICSLPNGASIEMKVFGHYWHGLDIPRHLQMFSPQTIKLLFEQAGLRLERVKYSPVPNDWLSRCRTRPNRTRQLLFDK